MNVLMARGQLGCPYPAVERGVRAREGAEPTALPSFVALADPRVGPAVHLLLLSTCTPCQAHVTPCDPSSQCTFPSHRPPRRSSVPSAVRAGGAACPCSWGASVWGTAPHPHPSPCCMHAQSCAGGSAGVCSLKESLTDLLCVPCAASQGLVNCGRRRGKGRRTRDAEERGGRERQRGGCGKKRKRG